MPVSADSFDALTTQFLTTLQPKRVLDIGCGEGKYGKLVKAISPLAHIEGIEIEASYVTKFGLNLIYDQVTIGDASKIAFESEATYDLAIIGDCIEHMPKSMGLDLINALVHQCAYILIIAPYAMRQDTIDGVTSERHRSIWSERDFQFHDYWAWTQITFIQWFLLRGYLPSDVALHTVVSAVEENKIIITNPFKESDYVKPANLQIVDYRKVENVEGVNWVFRPN